MPYHLSIRFKFVWYTNGSGIQMFSIQIHTVIDARQVYIKKLFGLLIELSYIAPTQQFVAPQKSLAIQISHLPGNQIVSVFT
jgi:hypothetical protein